MVKQGVYDHIEKWENYHCELGSLLPWLRLRRARSSDQGSTLQIVECAMLTTTMEGGDSPRTVVEDGMKPHMGGATT